MITDSAPPIELEQRGDTVRLTLSHEMDRLKSKLNEEASGRPEKLPDFLICLLTNLGDFVRRWEVYIAQTRR